MTPILVQKLDRYTNEVFSFSPTIYNASGGPMTDADVDDVIYCKGKENNLYFVRSLFLIDRTIKAEWFGIVGDGVTDYSIKIAYMFTIANKLKARTIYFGKGTFIGTWDVQTVNLVSGAFNVKGSGKLSTIFKSTSTSSDCITINGSNIRMSGFDVINSKNGITIGNVKASDRIYLENINLTTNVNGVYIKSLVTAEFKNVYGSYSTGSGLLLLPASIVTCLILDTCQWRWNQEYGINIQAGKLINIKNNVFEVNYKAGTYLRGGVSEQTSTIKFENSWWEQNCQQGGIGISQILIDGIPDGSSKADNIIFEACNIPFGFEVPAMQFSRASNISVNNSNIAYGFVMDSGVTAPPYNKYSFVRNSGDGKVYISLITANSQPFTNVSAWEVASDSYSGYNITNIKNGIVSTVDPLNKNILLSYYKNPLPNDYLIIKNGVSLKYIIDNVLYDSMNKNSYVANEYVFSGSNTKLIKVSGDPEGIVTALPGCVGVNTNISSKGTTPFYYKFSGSGNTGWRPMISNQAVQVTIAAATTRTPEDRDEVYRVSAATADYAITLPLSNSVISGKSIKIVRVGSTVFKISLSVQGADIISKAIVLETDMDNFTIVSNGVNLWNVIEYNKTTLSQPNSTATDISGIVADFNSFLQKQRASGQLAT